MWLVQSIRGADRCLSAWFYHHSAPYVWALEHSVWDGLWRWYWNTDITWSRFDVVFFIYGMCAFAGGVDSVEGSRYIRVSVLSYFGVLNLSVGYCFYLLSSYWKRNREDRVRIALLVADKLMHQYIGGSEWSISPVLSRSRIGDSIRTEALCRGLKEAGGSTRVQVWLCDGNFQYYSDGRIKKAI